MAVSSSAIRIVPRAMCRPFHFSSWERASRSGQCLQLRCRVTRAILHGEEHAKHGSFGFAVAFDDAAVVANDLGDEREAKSGAGALGGDKRIKQMRLHV